MFLRLSCSFFFVVKGEKFSFHCECKCAWETDCPKCRINGNRENSPTCALKCYFFFKSKYAKVTLFSRWGVKYIYTHIRGDIGVCMKGRKDYFLHCYHEIQAILVQKPALFPLKK
ncbi:uncharacterized protein TEOVI_000068000 [Trypanosoma equiperdum]|uniref:Uncharacterized protein n=1 Tax=Trypanosoma equiperdum TaxID=5694 RepID=A0A1G4IAQ5_TRYEQ|nr:hypothetical protein, conserved [Trypanosoma equiperdum]